MTSSLPGPAPSRSPRQGGRGTRALSVAPSHRYCDSKPLCGGGIGGCTCGDGRTDGWSLWLCHVMLSALGQAMADSLPASSTLCKPHVGRVPSSPPLYRVGTEQREGPSASLGTARTPMGVAVERGEGEKQEKSGRPPQRGVCSRRCSPRLAALGTEKHFLWSTL